MSTSEISQIMEALSRLERQVEAIRLQVVSLGERTTNLEESAITPIPGLAPDEQRRRRPTTSGRAWRRHVVELLLHLVTVLVLLGAGALLLGRPLDWPELGGLALLGLWIAGRDVRGMLGLGGRPGGGGGSNGAAIGGAVLVLAALSSGWGAP